MPPKNGRKKNGRVKAKTKKDKAQDKEIKQMKSIVLNDAIRLSDGILATAGAVQASNSVSLVPALLPPSSAVIVTNDSKKYNTRIGDIIKLRHLFLNINWYQASLGSPADDQRAGVRLIIFWSEKQLVTADLIQMYTQNGGSGFDFYVNKQTTKGVDVYYDKTFTMASLTDEGHYPHTMRKILNIPLKGHLIEFKENSNDVARGFLSYLICSDQQPTVWQYTVYARVSYDA